MAIVHEQEKNIRFGKRMAMVFQFVLFLKRGHVRMMVMVMFHWDLVMMSVIHYQQVELMRVVKMYLERGHVRLKIMFH
jgi:hypothetical protein